MSVGAVLRLLIFLQDIVAINPRIGVAVPPMIWHLTLLLYQLKAV
jgi:hypothetical protein